jgi:hypothetical protein
MSCEIFEALEQTLQEIDALSAIYSSSEEYTTTTLGFGNDEPTAPENTTSSSATCIHFSVLSLDEYAYAKGLLLDSATRSSNLQDGQQVKIPTLVVQVLWKSSQEANGGHLFQQQQQQQQQHQQQEATVHFEIPPGYPATMSCFPHVSVVSITNWNRKQREELGNAMNEKARELSGSEALMELIHFFQDSMASCCSSNIMGLDQHGTATRGRTTNQSSSLQGQITRCWIWVHHITNAGRCKDIVREAKQRELAGYLKHGYPGIVVVEGPTALCHDFVQWIKGSKSRPGGFGRNWGHHVRGQIVLDKGSKRSFTNEFQDIGEDLASLASISRNNGVEDEFLKHVMQH